MSYFTGDNVPLKFTVTEGGVPVTPTVAKVTIVKPNFSMTAEVNATISSNVVSYVVPASVTTLQGYYEAYFVLTISGNERTHKMLFNVVVNP